MKAPFDSSYKFHGSPTWLISRHGSTGRQWLDGVVRTDHGTVEVYSQHDHSHYAVVFAGRVYNRSEQRERTRRGLIQCAYRFMSDVVAGRVI